MECMDKERALKALDALKDLVSDEKAPVKMVSLEETQRFSRILSLGVYEKIRFKGGLNLRFLKKGDEVYVCSTNIPEFEPGDENAAIYRNDFTYLVDFGEGRIREFAGDSRYFERVVE